MANKNIALIVLLVLFRTIVQSQNLIPNAGFEYSFKCPDNTNQIWKCTGWKSASKASPDFYHECGSDGVQIPNTAYGNQDSFEGKAYVGLHGRKGYREYITIRLKEPLLAGQVYESSIFICSSNYFSSICSDIGFYFSKERIQQDHQYILKGVVPQIQSHPDSLFSDFKWHKIGGSFIAIGGEQYLTIGSFRVAPKTIELKEGIKWYTYLDNLTTVPVRFSKMPIPIIDQIKNLDQIYFKTGSADLMDESFNELDRLVEILNKNKLIKISVLGHTDSQGNEGVNKKLSIDRAKSVVDYLIQKGINDERLSYSGFGSNRPIANNLSDKDRELNRRVEIVVVK